MEASTTFYSGLGHRGAVTENNSNTACDAPRLLAVRRYWVSIAPFALLCSSMILIKTAKRASTTNPLTCHPEAQSFPTSPPEKLGPLAPKAAESAQCRYVRLACTRGVLLATSPRPPSRPAKSSMLTFLDRAIPGIVQMKTGLTRWLADR